jgi:glutamine cyclotransferase
MTKKTDRQRRTTPLSTFNKQDPEEGRLFYRPDSGRRWFLIGLFLFIAIGGSCLVMLIQQGGGSSRHTFKLIKKHPHDQTLFTQGIVVDADGRVFESSGQRGFSAITESELTTGKQLQQKKLDAKFFGEGLTKWNDTLIQLTWEENTAFVYDLQFNELKRFEYDGDGWGLTNTPTELVMSNGTPRLAFLDPETFKENRAIRVQSGRRPISQLNELEYIGGKIFANQLNSDLIYEINPANGNVESIIDLNGLWPASERPEKGILNGIAFDPRTRSVLVTGKYCPFIFEIEFVPK